MHQEARNSRCIEVYILASDVSLAVCGQYGQVSLLLAVLSIRQKYNCETTKHFQSANSGNYLSLITGTKKVAPKY